MARVPHPLPMVLRACLENEPDERPDAPDVVATLRQALEALAAAAETEEVPLPKAGSEPDAVDETSVTGVSDVSEISYVSELSHVSEVSYISEGTAATELADRGGLSYVRRDAPASETGRPGTSASGAADMALPPPKTSSGSVEESFPWAMVLPIAVGLSVVMGLVAYTLLG